MIAVIGCGYWGKNLIRNFAELGVLSAICDHDQKKAEALGKFHGVRSLSVDDVLADVSIKAVVIAAAPRFNTELSYTALKAGKHVLVEKPYAFTHKDSEHLESYLLELKQKSSPLVFMVGHLLLYHSAFLKIKELIAAGTIGSVQEIRCFRHGLGRVREEFGVLWELAPHDVSMMLDLNPYSVKHIEGLTSRSLTGKQDTIRVRYDFSNGVSGLLSCSWAEPVKQQQLIVQGTHGYLIFDDTKGWAEKVHLIQFEDPMAIESINQNQYVVKAVPIDEKEVLKAECQHFLDCIEQATPPVSDIKQARKVFDLLMRTQKILDDRKDLLLSMEDTDQNVMY